MAIVNPSPPIIAMYAYEMAKIEAEPTGAAETAPCAGASTESVMTWPGKNGTNCGATPIGPMPGPPPPCGIQKVLCRFKWHTSAPIRAGDVNPTCAFMFAPSIYTCPPNSWIIWQMSMMLSSNTPCVLGYVIIKQAKLSLCSSAFARSSATSIFPFASQGVTITFMPAITAEAGLVPCAEEGISAMLRCESPREAW